MPDKWDFVDVMPANAVVGPIELAECPPDIQRTIAEMDCICSVECGLVGTQVSRVFESSVGKAVLTTWIADGC